LRDFDSVEVSCFLKLYMYNSYMRRDYNATALTVQLGDLRGWVERAARKRGLPPSAFIRELISSAAETDPDEALSVLTGFIEFSRRMMRAAGDRLISRDVAGKFARAVDDLAREVRPPSSHRSPKQSTPFPMRADEDKADTKPLRVSSRAWTKMMDVLSDFEACLYGNNAK
jgi:hypothetical protein